MRKVLRDTASKTYYICGPSGMYDFCMPELEKIAFPRAGYAARCSAPRATSRPSPVA